MLDNTTSMNAGACSRPGMLFQTHLFLARHGSALEAAANLLGGPRWSCRVRQLCADVGNGLLPRCICMRELHALLDLLRLESVDDLSTDEAAFFARIDPMDPRVHELCHLTDQLAQFLETIARQEPRADSQT